MRLKGIASCNAMPGAFRQTARSFACHGTRLSRLSWRTHRLHRLVTALEFGKFPGDIDRNSSRRLSQIHA
jgi:hypothetical protein